jgi:hypothetical protein
MPSCPARERCSIHLLYPEHDARGFASGWRVARDQRLYGSHPPCGRDNNYQDYGLIAGIDMVLVAGE